jgi:carbamate kinase
MITVVAIGGHALATPGAPLATDLQRVDAAALAISEHLSGDALLVTHGNGPQAGWLAAQAEAAIGSSLSLDAITAQSEGLTGYQLQLALENALPQREITTLLTQVEVDPADPALDRPSKPIGRVYDDEEADCLRARGLTVGPDRGGFRRMVPSPRPQRVLELDSIRRLLDVGGIVVCGGGGGIPVGRGADGRLHGVDAIVDKDHTSALLASALGARRLFLLTDVPGIYPEWPATDPVLRSADPEALVQRGWAEGSMAPKVEAAIRFTREPPGTAWIGRIEDLAEMVEGAAGTRIASASPWTEVSIR